MVWQLRVLHLLIHLLICALDHQLQIHEYVDAVRYGMEKITLTFDSLKD